MPAQAIDNLKRWRYYISMLRRMVDSGINDDTASPERLEDAVAEYRRLYPRPSDHAELMSRKFEHEVATDQVTQVKLERDVIGLVWHRRG